MSLWLSQTPDGSWLAPAFSDRHCHPLFAARERAAFDISGLTSAEAIVAALRGYLAANQSTLWLDAATFDSNLPFECLAKTLDQVSQEIPITLHSADHHALWVNSAALEVAGLSSAPAALADGEVVCDANGRPSGLLLEWAAMKLVLDHQPIPALQADIENLLNADATLNGFGVVRASDAWIDPGMGEVFLAAAASHKLKVDYELWVRFSVGEMQHQFDYLKRLVAEFELSTPVGLTLAGAKIFLDGVISSKTAALSEHYLDGTSATLLWSDSQLDELLAKISDLSPMLRPHFHAIGDAAVNQGLNAIKRARSANLWQGSRMPAIAHAELVSASDAVRFAELQVEAVVSPQWLGEADSLAAHLSRPVAEAVGDFSRLLRAGATISYGSDWPVSEPNPMLAISAGVKHLVARGMPLAAALEQMWKIASGPEWLSGRQIRLSANPLKIVAANVDDLALIGVSWGLGQ